MHPVCSRSVRYLRKQKLSSVSQKECVETRASKAAKTMGDISETLLMRSNSHAQENGYSVVEEIGGHGIGLESIGTICKLCYSKGQRDGSGPRYDVHD